MNLELEILSANYWEHFKFAKDIAMYLQLEDPKRVKVEKELNAMLERMHELSNSLKINSLGRAL